MTFNADEELDDLMHGVELKKDAAMAMAVKRFASRLDQRRSMRGEYRKDSQMLNVEM